MAKLRSFRRRAAQRCACPLNAQGTASARDPSSALLSCGGAIAVGADAKCAGLSLLPWSWPSLCMTFAGIARSRAGTGAHPGAAYRGRAAAGPVRWVHVPGAGERPVYRLDRDPTRCVRYDRHAVHLGRPAPTSVPGAPGRPDHDDQRAGCPGRSQPGPGVRRAQDREACRAAAPRCWAAAGRTCPRTRWPGGAPDQAVSRPAPGRTVRGRTVDIDSTGRVYGLVYRR